MDRHGIDYSFGDIVLEAGYETIPVRDPTDHLKAERYGDPDALLRGLRDALRDWKGVDIPLDQMERPEDQAAS
jgi:hypothetical protein